jgi:hypothetical protein
MIMSATRARDMSGGNRQTVDYVLQEYMTLALCRRDENTQRSANRCLSHGPRVDDFAEEKGSTNTVDKGTVLHRGALTTKRRCRVD